MLRGRRLAVARVTWAVLASSAVTVSLVGLPARYAAFRALSDYDPAVRGIVRANLAELGLSVSFYAFYLLPDGKFVPRWTRWLAVPILLYAAPTALIPDSPASPENWPALPYTLLLASLLLTGVFAQIYRYRLLS